MRILIALACAGLAACGADRPPRGHALVRRVIADRCGACHTVPGVGEATGRVGPDLGGIGSQQVIGGRFPNSRANMIRWITHAQTLDPGNVMPDIPLTDRQAAAVADYLYALDRS